jgi:hypothetical protein
VSQADKLSKTQVQFANEGAEKKQREEEVAARKRKVEDKEKWEGESYYHLHLDLFFLFSPQSEILRVFSNRLPNRLWPSGIEYTLCAPQPLRHPPTFFQYIQK